MDAHQSQMDSSDLLPLNDQPAKAVVPTICLSEETDSPPITLVNSSSAREGMSDSGEHSVLAPSSTGTAEKVGSPHLTPDVNCRAVGSEKTSPHSTDDS